MPLVEGFPSFSSDVAIPGEITQLGLSPRKELGALLELNGLLEPYYASSANKKRRWTLEYRSRLARKGPPRP